MQIEFIESGNQKIARVTTPEILIPTTQDTVELMMNCYYQGADSLILYETNLPAAFFDLKTKLAGDILQKFSNSGMRLAIVGDFAKYDSQSLKDFIYESNKSRLVNFVGSVEEAEIALA